jgi:hypothetical protein
MRDLRIRILRDKFGPKWTLSRVLLDWSDDADGWLPFGYAVEDVDRHVEEAASRKVKRETAIPLGTYRVHLYDSPRHGKRTPELRDVPGFGHIQIHPGNSASDTEGCLCIGLTRDTDRGLVGRSRVACDWLCGEIRGVIVAGGEVTVEVMRE